MWPISTLRDYSCAMVCASKIDCKWVLLPQSSWVILENLDCHVMKEHHSYVWCAALICARDQYGTSPE